MFHACGCTAYVCVEGRAYSRLMTLLYHFMLPQNLGLGSLSLLPNLVIMCSYKDYPESKKEEGEEDKEKTETEEKTSEAAEGDVQDSKKTQ